MKKSHEKKTLFHVPVHRDGGLCILKIIYLFIIAFLWGLCWVLFAVCNASSGGYSLVAVHRLLTVGACLIADCGLQGMCAQQLQLTGLVTLGHVESSC